MLEVITALYASKHKWVARVMLWCAAAFILFYEILQFVKTGVMPIAFSTFSYFLFGIAVFLPLRPIKSAAAICAFVSGLTYLSGFVFYPNANYNAQPDEMKRMVGFLLHNLLLFGSLLLYGQYKVKKTDIFYAIGYFVFIIVYTELAVRVFGNPHGNSLTLGVIEATLILQIAPQFVIAWWWYILWYALVAVIFWGVWELTRFINRRLLRQ